MIKFFFARICIVDVNNTSTSGQSPSSSNSNSLKKNTSENTFNDILSDKDNKVSQYLGISHGQIEYSLNEKIGSASHENLQHSRTVTMVNSLYLILTVSYYVLTVKSIFIKFF